MGALADKWRKLSERLDGPIAVVSPKLATSRRTHRFMYDAIDRHRTRKKRGSLIGTGDAQLTESNLGDLRQIARDMSRNNPLAVGLLKIERDGVIGSGPTIQCRTQTEEWNVKAEALWKERMVEQPVDITGRYNINQFMRKAFISYRRDGDFLTVFAEAGLLPCEGDQIGTPYGAAAPDTYEVINGVAYSKQTGALLGYYVGKPDKWGYITGNSYQKFSVDESFLWSNPERFSQSRGEPVLTPSIDWIDKLSDYMDAELVAAKVNACYVMFIAKNQDYGDLVPPAYTKGVSSSGYDDDGNQLEKMEPGMILYGETGEAPLGIGQTRPGNQFEPFVSKILTLIGRPLCMPLMLITGDFSGATFMNARIAYQKAQELWICEQEDVVKPFVRRVWRWFIERMIMEGAIEDALDKYVIDVQCNRWPYVDPTKEAMGDKQQLENRTITRQIICNRQGHDFVDILAGLEREQSMLVEAGLSGAPVATPAIPAEGDKSDEPDGNDNAK